MPTAAPTEAPTEELTGQLTSTSTIAPTVTPTAEPTKEPIPAGPPADVSLGDTWPRPTDGMVMVYVPAGEFEMGSELGDPEADDDEVPQHTVALNGYWIDQTQVTNTQYRRCVEAGLCQAPTTCDWGEPTYADVSKADHPVVCVDWYSAAAYCEWAGVRLPTEAEWEYAARGPDERRFPWGDEFDGTRLNFCDVKCSLESRTTRYDDGYALTAPVGSYLDGASWCRALDMAGNVWEWVADWYDKDYYDYSPSKNPEGPSSGLERVLRGGTWHSPQRFVHTASREHYEPDTRTSESGFRCAVEP
jgi:formylglycine-generating enzyme required for sulfatase activity